LSLNNRQIVDFLTQPFQPLRSPPPSRPPSSAPPSLSSLSSSSSSSSPLLRRQQGWWIVLGWLQELLRPTRQPEPSEPDLHQPPRLHPPPRRRQRQRRLRRQQNLEPRCGRRCEVEGGFSPLSAIQILSKPSASLVHLLTGGWFRRFGGRSLWPWSYFGGHLQQQQQLCKWEHDECN